MQSGKLISITDLKEEEEGNEQSNSFFAILWSAGDERLHQRLKRRPKPASPKNKNYLH